MTKQEKEHNQRIENLEKRFDLFNEKTAKHIEVLNGEVGEIQVDVAVVKTDVGWIRDKIKGVVGSKTDVKWLKKTMFVVLPVLAGMITTLIYFALKFK